MMITCRDHSDDKAGITTFSIVLTITHVSEHQDYNCNTLPLTTIFWKWISFVLPCFKYASSSDRHSITLGGESLWKSINFLWQMSHKCVNCVLACLEINDTIYPDPFRRAILCRNRSLPESTQWCKLDAAPIWHIMAYLYRCNIL